MTAKKYLSQALWLDRIIDNKIRYQEKLRTMAEKTTVDVSRERVSGGNAVNTREDIIVKLADLSHEVNEDIDRLIDLQKEIMDTIDQVDDIRLRVILEMRYIRGKEWIDIVSSIGYNKRYVMKLHEDALKEIDEILGKTLNNTCKLPKV